MKQEIKVGVVCVARKTFDYKAAEEIYTQIKIDLKKIEKIEMQVNKETLRKRS